VDVSDKIRSPENRPGSISLFGSSHGHEFSSADTEKALQEGKWWPREEIWGVRSSRKRRSSSILTPASKRGRPERWRELDAKGVNITLEEVRKQVQRRDQLDSEREFSP
jgi:hypothetical protein